MYQLRFWNVLKELKAQEIYLQLYACRDEGIDKTINIILAIASSSSIAAWAIWKELHIIWAILIAAAQVISAIKPFLPYKNRLRAVLELNNKIQILTLEAEIHWYSVSEGLFTEQEIHNLTLDLKDKIVKAEQLCMKNDLLKAHQELKIKAENQADIYFVQNYQGQ